jgi:hypothetical protein
MSDVHTCNMHALITPAHRHLPSANVKAFPFLLFTLPIHPFPTQLCGE